jgi:hypothetical protein
LFVIDIAYIDNVTKMLKCLCNIVSEYAKLLLGLLLLTKLLVIT